MGYYDVTVGQGEVFICLFSRLSLNGNCLRRIEQAAKKYSVHFLNEDFVLCLLKIIILTSSKGRQVF